MSEEKRTEIGEIGEFGLIDQLAEKVRYYHGETVKGIGDDAAVYDAGDHYMLISSDMLLEGVHFDLSYMPLQHLGYKAVAVNVSDLAAMNGVPRQITVNLGLSNRFSVEAVELIYEGIRAACEAFKVDLVGGDTTTSKSGLVISVTATGAVDKDKIVYRSGAKESEILCVTGDVGAAFIGLNVLEREKQEFLGNPDMQPKLDKYPYVVGRQLRPQARMDIIHEFADLGIVPTSMIDVSDGLASEIFHLCKHSGLGAAIYEDKLPIDKEAYETAAEFSIDPNTCALNGGEDYELLFTIKQEDFEKLKNHAEIHTIGYMQAMDKGRTMVTRNNNVIELQAQGWKHF
ncbi:thiamine-phosphate kinase [Marinoscillum furvescens]|uniref:Thiamine-monophosphate kinase n=1 Tax=Marinoscillum furvescens DSM 4134 TaxID=1122208 RepID=A0A3D9L4T7_MARFU|nr:thiamine-phosphate kinase [Marinoscillum furvescens]REE00992.1 thiamine-phosphate kinase [Marinoscillum furvescens DSM 4134]